MTSTIESLKNWSAALSALFSAGFGIYVTMQNHAIEARLKDLDVAGKRAEIAASFAERLGKEGGILASKDQPEKELLAISAMYALVADDANPTYRNIIRRTVYKLSSTLGKIHLGELEADTCKTSPIRCKKEIDPKDGLRALNELDSKVKQQPIGSANLLTDQAVVSPTKDKGISQLQDRLIESIITIESEQDSPNQVVKSSTKGVIHLGNLQDSVNVCSSNQYRLTSDRVNPLAKSYKFQSQSDENAFLKAAKLYDANQSSQMNQATGRVSLLRATNVRRDFPVPRYDPKSLPEITAILKPDSKPITISNPRIRISSNSFCSLWARVQE